MNDVAVVDHVPTVAAFWGDASAPQGQHQAAAEEALQPLVIQANAQAMADEA